MTRVVIWIFNQIIFKIKYRKTFVFNNILFKIYIFSFQMSRPKPKKVKRCKS